MFYDVLICGGGPAGIAAAIEIQRQGLSYLILEARSRVGGRVLSSDELDATIDLGASWLHHFGPSNPVAHVAYSNGSFLGAPQGGCDLFVSRDGTRSLNREDFESAGEAYDQMELLREEQQHCEKFHAESPFHITTYQDFCRALRSSDSFASTTDVCTIDPCSMYDPCDLTACKESDSSLSEFFSSPRVRKIASSMSPEARSMYDSFVGDIECYEGASLAQLSCKHAGEECEGVPDSNMQFISGYGHMLQQVAKEKNLNLQLDTEVTEVHYGVDDVTVKAIKISPEHRRPTAHGSSAHPFNHAEAAASSPAVSSAPQGEVQEFRARFCLVTVPLGVLKRNLISFSPPLPARKVEAIQSMGFGVLDKVALKFPRAFWTHEHTNILAVMSEPDAVDPYGQPEQPLWIVNMSRPLQQLAKTRQIQQERQEAKHGPAWQEWMTHSRPLAPVFLLEHEQHVGEELELEGESTGSTASVSMRSPSAAIKHSLSHLAASSSSITAPSSSSHVSRGQAVPASALPVTPSAAASASSATAASSSDGESSDGPHILVSFHHSFHSSPNPVDSHHHTVSSHESLTDDQMVEKVMRQLRRAFQCGISERIEEGSEQARELKGRSVHLSTTSAASTVAGTMQVVVDASFKSSSTTVEIPSSHRFSVGTYDVSTAPACIVPDPTSYVVTRWGQEPYSLGAYAHYAPGTGMHTCAELGRPVSATPSCTPRLLFAGEATLGVHLGCADSAWLSGLREARRIQRFMASETDHSSATPVPAFDPSTSN